MGSSSSKSTSDSTQTQQTTFEPRTPEEAAILKQLTGLGTEQQDAIMQQLQSLQGGASPFALGAADQAQLDQAFGSAQQQLELGNKDYADFLSGGRGMRMNSTPIAQQAMQRQALGLSDLLGQRAMAGLNMGLQGNQYRNSAAMGLSSALPSGLAAAFNPYFQERLAGGTTTGTSHSEGTQRNTPSIMSQISQGIGIASQLGGMGMGFMGGGIGGLGKLSAGASNTIGPAASNTMPSL